MTDPILKPMGDAWWVIWPEFGVLEFDRISEQRDSLSAEVTAASIASGELHWSRITLVSGQSRAGFAAVLDRREPEQSWPARINAACRMVAKAVRLGEPAVDLVATPPSPGQWLVQGLVPQNQLTVLFGDGGTGKSYLALALVVS